MEIYGMTGEKLGTIGSSDKKSDEMPQWQRDFISKPSISIRKGIAWGYNAPYEDTDTLVLTSPSSRYIDIRLPKAIDEGLPVFKHSSFWAFTGTSTTTFPGTKDVPLKHVAHGAWKREIDSKGTDIIDEGDMFELPNGDVVEVGEMENPSTGKVQMYKEYWTSPAADSNADSKSKACIVAEVVGQDNSDDRGLIVRVGDYCQGLFESVKEGSTDVFAVARWTRAGSGAKWEEDPRSGFVATHSGVPVAVDSFIPCLWAVEESRITGDEIVAGKVRWKIVESSR